MSGSDAFVYEFVPGYFADVGDNNGIAVDQVPPRFGLIDSSLARWQTLKAQLLTLNRAAPNGTTYRVLFLGRHGQGVHNVAEKFYGTKKWDEHESKLNGDENMTWGPDPKLTELGVQQAQSVNNAWKAEIEHGIPLPESLYSSPFTRAAHTALLTFDGILINSTSPTMSRKRPLIKEKLREVNGVHTCDRRKRRSYIEKAFPQFDIEPDFTEEDELWRADRRETDEELTVRSRQVLDEIFSKDTATYISISAHGGVIKGLMTAVTAPPRQLPTGGVICLVIKVTGVSGTN